MGRGEGHWGGTWGRHHTLIHFFLTKNFKAWNESIWKISSQIDQKFQTATSKLVPLTELTGLNIWFSKQGGLYIWKWQWTWQSVGSPHQSKRLAGSDLFSWFSFLPNGVKGPLCLQQWIMFGHYSCFCTTIKWPMVHAWHSTKFAGLQIPFSDWGGVLKICYIIYCSTFVSSENLNNWTLIETTPRGSSSISWPPSAATWVWGAFAAQAGADASCCDTKTLPLSRGLFSGDSWAHSAADFCLNWAK